MMHLRYASYVIRHKWWVLVAGLRIGAPLWLLLVHDLSKFMPSEWFAYATYFWAPKPIPALPRILARRQDAFDAAWLLHQHRNPHHWQFWLLREDDGGAKCLPMPRKYVLEMVADWMGAGRAITGRWECAAWYAKNRDRMLLHQDTRDLVESILEEHAPPKGNDHA
jgi:hypothetical protein